ncbi:MAG: protein-disulfide reductase DsbD domain-containing protein [Pseudorhodobacter sp.]
MTQTPNPPLALFTILATLLLAALPLRAEPPGFEGAIRPGWVMENGNRMAALHLRLNPGWKTYWRAPGDSGIPPSFDWTGSRNLGAVRFHWPRPEVSDGAAGRTIGYSRELILPMEVQPSRRGEPMHLQGEVELGVCKDICIPASFRFSVTLPGPGQKDESINRALRQRPSTPREAGMRRIGCSLSPTAEGLRMEVLIDMPSTGGPETVVVEPGGNGIWVSEAAVRREGKTLWASVDLIPTAGRAIALDRESIIVTVLGRNRAVEIKGCPAPRS